MPHDTALIFTLTGGLSAALVLGMLAVRLRLSPVVGYVLAGVVVGPFTPGFVAHAGLASELAEVGVILLMFGLGLQFHVEELLAVRKIALPGALAAMAAATAAGTVAGRALGFSTAGGVAFGEAAAVRSAGADVVVISEAEVALAMTEQLLTELGATPEQLDRARDRVRSELR